MAYQVPPTKADGNPITAADHNTYLRDNFVEVEARKETQYVQVGSSVPISGTTAASATTIITAEAFTPNGTDRYRVEFGIGELSIPGHASGNTCVFHLYDGAANLGRVAAVATDATTRLVIPVAGRRTLTPGNAPHTYSIRAHRGNADCTAVGGGGGADVALPIWLSITRLP